MDGMGFESVDGFQKNVERIAEIFPSCVREGKNERGETVRGIDLQALRLLLGDSVIGDERYEFCWIGKRESLLEANRPVKKILRPVIGDSVQWDTTGNLYIEGDNLDALKLLQESYFNSVKVIYIDPPYNTGNDFVYADNFKKSDWCSMIYSRLTVARNLLREDGAIFISIDDCEQENLKKICDEVFGEKNYVNTFIWNCSTAGGIRPRFASKTHEYIFCYGKDKSKLKSFWAPLSGDAVKMYHRRDEEGRLYRDKDFVFKNKSANEKQKYEIVCPDGERVHPKDGYIYRFVRERFDQALREGLVTFKRSANGPLENADGGQAHWNIYIKKYLGDAMGAPSTLVPKESISIYNVGTRCVQELFDGVRVFENVKPVNVIQYFINMVVEDGDTVMDFFSGSASTAHAVMQTQVDKKLELHYILVQLPEPCREKSEAYRAGYPTICEIGKERIRRAAERLRAEEGGRDRDFGFRVFRVEDADMTDVCDTAGEASQDTPPMENGEKSGWSDLDLLFGCLLKWGMPISLPYSLEHIDGCRIHTYNGGDLIACFEEEISENVVRTIALRRPVRAVFREQCFSDSSSKIDVGEIFRMLSPDTKVIVIGEKDTYGSE